MEPNSLHARLLEDARKYDPAEHNRQVLAPYRDVLLIWRAKFLSYEQIAARLTAQGLAVSQGAVGVFCRMNFTKAEILRERARIQQEERPRQGVAASAPKTASPPGAKAPRIARDDY